MTPDVFPDVVEAKCECCGHIWQYRRHDAFACPFCNARFENVDFNYGKSYAFFYGRRWKEILREQAVKQAKTLPEYLTKPCYHEVD